MIITLCGSARFERQFHLWDEALTLAGHTVFNLAVYPSTKGQKNWYNEETKALLDSAHRRKIAASDAIVVLNRFAYIGESTLAEIEFARGLEKPVHFLESWDKGCGIDGRHSREAGEVLPLRYPGSPIRTMVGAHSLNRGVWERILLGPAGEFRQRLAHLVQS